MSEALDRTSQAARVATGRDFDDEGRLTRTAAAANVVHLHQDAAQALVGALAEAPVAVRSVAEPGHAAGTAGQAIATGEVALNPSPAHADS